MPSLNATPWATLETVLNGLGKAGRDLANNAEKIGTIGQRTAEQSAVLNQALLDLTKKNWTGDGATTFTEHARVAQRHGADLGGALGGGGAGKWNSVSANFATAATIMSNTNKNFIAEQHAWQAFTKGAAVAFSNPFNPAGVAGMSGAMTSSTVSGLSRVTTWDLIYSDGTYTATAKATLTQGPLDIGSSYTVAMEPIPPSDGGIQQGQPIPATSTVTQDNIVTVFVDQYATKLRSDLTTLGRSYTAIADAMPEVPKSQQLTTSGNSNAPGMPGPNGALPSGALPVGPLASNGGALQTPLSSGGTGGPAGAGVGAGGAGNPPGLPAGAGVGAGGNAPTSLAGMPTALAPPGVGAGLPPGLGTGTAGLPPGLGTVPPITGVGGVPPVAGIPPITGLPGRGGVTTPVGPGGVGSGMPIMPIGGVGGGFPGVGRGGRGIGGGGLGENPFAPGGVGGRGLPGEGVIGDGVPGVGPGGGAGQVGESLVPAAARAAAGEAAAAEGAAGMPMMPFMPMGGGMGGGNESDRRRNSWMEEDDVWSAGTDPAPAVIGQG